MIRLRAQYGRGNRRAQPLIVPSANIDKKRPMKNVKADVVFLSLDTLGQRSRRYIARYWNEVVRETEASWSFRSIGTAWRTM
jgi:hypothetical protein